MKKVKNSKKPLNKGNNSKKDDQFSIIPAEYIASKVILLEIKR